MWLSWCSKGEVVGQACDPSRQRGLLYIALQKHSWRMSTVDLTYSILLAYANLLLCRGHGTSGQLKFETPTGIRGDGWVRIRVHKKQQERMMQQSWLYEGLGREEISSILLQSN